MIGMLIWDRAGHDLRPVRMKEISVLHVRFLCGEVTALERTADAAAEKYGLLPSGGSDFHGENKPDIRLGTGRGALDVPDEWYEALREAAEKA